MIPFTRITTFIFFVATLICTADAGVALKPHPYMSFEVMLWATLSVFLIFSISLFRSFVTDLIAILWTGFVTQRFIVLYIWPKETYYPEWIVFDTDTMLRVMIFVFLSALSLALGAFFALSHKRKIYPRQLSHIATDAVNTLQPINLYGKSIAFEKLAVVTSWMIIVAVFFKLYFMLSLGIGFMGQPYERESAVLFRLINMPSSLFFIVVIAVVMLWKRLRQYKTVLVALFLTMAVNIFMAPSKAALITLALFFIISFYLCKGFIPKKIAIYGLLAFFFTSTIYAAFAEQLRSIWLDSISGMPTPQAEFIYVSSFDTLFNFSKRMGAFDWLASIMKVGREAFYPSANLWLDMQGLINSFVPGDIIEPSADYIDISKRLPQLLRGWSGSYTGLGGHGENLGVFGMAYVYFGEFVGPVFFFFWVWGCIAADNSTMHVTVKMFIIQLFLLTVFTGGGFSPLFEHAVNIFYLSLLIYILLCFGSKTFVFNSRPLSRNAGFS